MSIVVQKYGGTSVGSPDRIKAVADRVIEAKKKYGKVVAVVSAMGKTTDQLIKLAKDVCDHPTAREYDALVSTGENVSASLLAMAIHHKGFDAVSLSGQQAGVRTENIFSKAKILSINPERIHKELDNNNIVIITGFQGINEYLDVVTIGRGGSDTSAVALAASLDSDVCEIYTDVDGVYTTDPRKVSSASKIHEISYEEMLELASLGATVLHPRAVECAKENNITLHVRSSFDLTEGTLVKEASAMEVNRPVTGVTMNDEQSTISILKVKDTPGVAGELFTKLADQSINVDMIIQSADEEDLHDITFTVDSDDADQAIAITQSYADEIDAQGIDYDKKMAKVSAVGVGMISKPGVAAQMFSALGQRGINIHLISTSEIKISCVVDQKNAQKALTVLHETFELDKI
jgi:aspartate kinase